MHQCDDDVVDVDDDDVDAINKRIYWFIEKKWYVTVPFFLTSQHFGECKL